MIYIYAFDDRLAIQSRAHCDRFIKCIDKRMLNAWIRLSLVRNFNGTMDHR